MSTANPEPYDERIRLAEIIADARELLAQPVRQANHPADIVDVLLVRWAARCGALEAMLKMLADSAAEALRLNEPEPQEASR